MKIDIKLRLTLDKFGFFSKKALVTLSSGYGFTAIGVRDPIQDMRESGLPFGHFYPDIISFIDIEGREVLVPQCQILRIEPSD